MLLCLPRYSIICYRVHSHHCFLLDLNSIFYHFLLLQKTIRCICQIHIFWFCILLLFISDKLDINQILNAGQYNFGLVNHNSFLRLLLYLCLLFLCTFSVFRFFLRFLSCHIFCLYHLQESQYLQQKIPVNYLFEFYCISVLPYNPLHCIASLTQKSINTATLNHIVQWFQKLCKVFVIIFQKLLSFVLI